jgi:hypothetical protein
MAQSAPPLRFLEDQESGYSSHSSAPSLRKKVIQTAGNLTSRKHVFSVYDGNGDVVSGITDDQKDNYYYYKGAVLILEALLFLYFLVFGLGAFATIIAEIELGSGWLIEWTGMVIIISIFAGLGFILIGLYCYFSAQFMKHGDEQFDELLANVMALSTMYLCAFGLLVKFFVLDDTNNTSDDLNFRRLLFTVVACYGIFGLILIIRAIARHLSVEKTVMINYQHWMYSTYNCPSEMAYETPTPNKSDTIYVHEHTAKPHWGVIGFMITMWVTTAVCLALTIWLLWMIVGEKTAPEFRTLYLTNFIALGSLYVILTVVWAAWNMMSEHYKGCFTAHFDVFYGTHAVYIAVIVFMLIGYRYTYWYVPDAFFENPGVTVPALKMAYFTKLAILMFVLLPLLAMGIAKGTCLMINEWPVNLPKYRQLFEDKQKAVQQQQ